jgi:tetratricopeptide (TPR) repeat protein
MQTLSPSPPIEQELGRIRGLSKNGQHQDALTAAEVLLAAAPQNRHALYLIATNQRCLHRIEEALDSLLQLEQEHPKFSLLFQERGYCYMSLRDAPRAVDAFHRAVDINPALLASWSMLERLYRQLGNQGNAAAAAGQVSALKRLAPEVVRAGSLFSDGELSVAENILREYLPRSGDDVEALRMLARIDLQSNELEEAESLFEHALLLKPEYVAARLDYTRVLLARRKYPRAYQEAEALLTVDPGNKVYLGLCAAACGGLGDHEKAIAFYRQLIAASSASADLHVMFGHSLQTVGRQKEAADSFSMAIELRPGFGDAWWSLANLKTYCFNEDEIERMRSEESVADAHPVDRYHLCFALGKAFEDRQEFAESWKFYDRGNALKRAETRYRPEIFEAFTRRQIKVCTAQFFAERAGFGVPNPDPIFIVGLPRSGSTLIEQILASHSQVEGTQELPDVQRIVQEMSGEQSGPGDSSLHPDAEDVYPGALTALSPEDFRKLGERYMTDTRIYRTGKPFFIDKMPNNFHHIGLIHLMMPNAKIIDVRREPMACCFSNLKQLFAGGQEFSYGIEEIARYYKSYLELMRHWDAVLPGRVLRVCYEDVVDSLEGSVRRILDFCRLPFEAACIEFHKTQRTVRTPSAEQVRQPIFRDGLQQWRNYEPWLSGLEDCLGQALARYRE